MANTKHPATGIQATLHHVTEIEVGAKLLQPALDLGDGPVAFIDLVVECDDSIGQTLIGGQVSHLFTLFVDVKQHLEMLRQIRDSADAALRAMEEMHQATLEVQP